MRARTKKQDQEKPKQNKASVALLYYTNHLDRSRAVLFDLPCKFYFGLRLKEWRTNSCLFLNAARLGRKLLLSLPRIRYRDLDMPRS